MGSGVAPGNPPGFFRVIAREGVPPTPGELEQEEPEEEVARKAIAGNVLGQQRPGPLPSRRD